MAKEGLNPKQAAFVREYLIDHNGTQAAIRAGYSEKTAKSKASQLLTIVNVADAIAEGEKKLETKAELTKEKIIERFDTIAERCMTEDVNNAIRANVEIGKLLGYYVEKSDNRHTIKVEYDEEPTGE